jgi:hypothetical protein
MDLLFIFGSFILIIMSTRLLAENAISFKHASKGWAAIVVLLFLTFIDTPVTETQHEMKLIDGKYNIVIFENGYIENITKHTGMVLPEGNITRRFIGKGFNRFYIYRVTPGREEWIIPKENELEE